MQSIHTWGWWGGGGDELSPIFKSVYNIYISSCCCWIVWWIIYIKKVINKHKYNWQGFKMKIQRILLKTRWLGPSEMYLNRTDDNTRIVNRWDFSNVWPALDFLSMDLVFRGFSCKHNGSTEYRPLWLPSVTRWKFHSVNCDSKK